MNNFSVLHILICSLILGSTSLLAFADIPTIEVGTDVSLSGVRPWNSKDFMKMRGYSAGLRGSLNFLFLESQAELLYQRVDDQNMFQANASAGVFFLKVHDLFIRKGGPNGNQTRAMAGIGQSYNMPFGLGRLTASVGAMILDWQHEGGPTQSLYGAYGGATMHMRIWKFKNELRVAYFVSPKLNLDYEEVMGGEEVIREWQHGVVTSDHLRLDLIKFPLMSLGPEARFQLAELPDGTEWFGTVGVGGNLGF